MLARALVPLLLLLGCAAPTPRPPLGPIKVLVVTGGHGFQAGPFFELFAQNPALSVTTARQDKAAEAYERGDLLAQDVVLLYDSPSEITDGQKARFLSLFERGVGVVVLHHALLSYQRWPEYERIAGGKYLLDDEKEGERVVTPESTYHPDLAIPVAVVARAHPVTAGLEDFTLRDELYRGVRMRPDVEVLLASGGEPLAWTRTEGRSRVVTTVLGHGRSAYEDPRFRRLLAQSLRWVARR